jgi:hypothetical protein
MVYFDNFKLKFLSIYQLFLILHSMQKYSVPSVVFSHLKEIGISPLFVCFVYIFYFPHLFWILCIVFLIIVDDYILKYQQPKIHKICYVNIFVLFLLGFSWVVIW